MAISKINPTDTIESGFRSKYNLSVDEIITAITQLADGKLRFTKFSGGLITIDTTYALQENVYTKSESDPFETDITAGQFVNNSKTVTHGKGTLFPTVNLFYPNGKPYNPVNYDYDVVDANNITLNLQESIDVHVKIGK